MVRLAIAYNPFDLTDISKHELVYDQHKTLADYLEGLPTEAGWSVGYEGDVIEPEAWADTKVNAFTHIVIVRTPHGGGGGGGKTVLRVVAMIAIAGFAAWAAPAILGGLAGVFGAGTAAAMGGLTSALAIVTGVTTVAGGMLINALLPATRPGRGGAEESPSYGLDGPKNTAREGGVVPIGYGEYRIAGNITDFYTRNVGRDQYMFLRTVLNQGEIQSIEDIEINGQPLSTYTDVQVRKRFGKDPEEPNDWFDEATRLINQNIHISQTFQERVTTAEVDRLRVDVVFPYGLYSIDQDDGATKDPMTVTLELQIAPCDEAGTPLTGFMNFPIVARRPVSLTGGFNRTSSGSTTAVVDVQTESSGDGTTYSVEGFYREVGSSTWISGGTVTGTAAMTSSGISNFDIEWPVIGYGFQFPTAGSYEMMVTGGTIQNDSGYSVSDETSETSLTHTDKTTKALRFTYESGTLSRSFYKVRVRRTTAEKQANGQTVDFVYDECYVTDIGEIDAVPVNLNGIANLSICIKASEQLTNIPTVTAKCKLSKVKIYDEDGTVTGTQWSDNPADVVADILHNTVRGAGFPTSKTVWSKYVEFREYCEDADLKFNGVYDTVNSLWDAVQSAAKVGHATVVPRGTKFSVAIDKADDPVALFTPSNMYKDSFKKSWMSITDRANEIQLKFADVDNSYTESTVRLADNASFARGAKQKIANVEGFGITSVAQATAEAEYYARQNSYIRSFVEFDAPLEAIGLTIGDVALIQHDSVDFNGGVGGRLKAGSSTTVINLDRPVSMSSGTYKLLVFQSAVERYDVTITNILGSRVSVSGLPNVAVADLPRVARIRQGSVDREIIDVKKVGSNWTLIVDGAADLANGAADLWDVDVIEERTVLTVAGESETVTLSAALSQAPAEYTNFLFGKQQTVKLPFRLRSINGKGIDRRTLSFVQYDERCYQSGGWDVPAVTSPGSGKVGQVKFLMANYTRTPLPTQDRIPVVLTWQKPDDTLYAGADIHMYEDDRWRLIATVADVTEFRSDFSRGEIIKFKVVGFDENRTRARFSDAPTVTVSLDVFEINLTPPTDLTSEIYWRTDAIMRLKWVEPPDADFQYVYRVQHKPLTVEQYNAFLAAADPDDYATVITSDVDYVTQPFAVAPQSDIPNVELGYYITRVRAEKGFNASPWLYLAVNVDAAEIPIAITGLTLTGGPGGREAIDDEFVGSDANWTWDDILAQAPSVTDPTTNLPLMLQDYRVRILDEEGEVLRTEYVTSPGYSYTYSKNNEDTPDEGTQKARREFTIEVRIRGRQGQLGLPAMMNVENPPAGLPTFIVPFADASAMFVRWQPNTEVDYAGTVVWMSTDDAFTPSDSNRVFSGKANNARIPIQTTQQYYVRVGHYDTFDDNPVNISAVTGAFVPALVVEDLQDVVEAGQAAAAAVEEFGEEIEKIATTALQLALKTVKDRDYAKGLTHLDGIEIGTVVVEETNARTEGDQAIIDTVNLIGAKSGDGLAFIIDGATLKVSPTESMAERFAAISAETGDVLAQLQDEITARTTALNAEISARTALGVRVDDAEAAIIDEASARASADAAEATARTTLAAQIADDIEAAIETEATVRASADETLAEFQALIGVKNGPGTAIAVDTTKLLIAGSESLATRLSGINSRFDTAEATIATETSTRVSAVAAVASSVSTLTTTVNGHTSSISTQQTSINGLFARYGLAVAVGNVITGFVANNDGVTGDFVIMANRFAIVDASKNNLKVPFQYSGGVVYMPNVVVDTLEAGIVTADKIVGGAVSNMTVGSAGGPTTLSTSETTVQYHSCISDGAKHLITAQVNLTQPASGVSGCIAYLKRGGSILASGACLFSGAFPNSITLVGYDLPGAGFTTYEITCTTTSGSTTSNRWDGGTIVSTELKK